MIAVRPRWKNLVDVRGAEKETLMPVLHDERDSKRLGFASNAANHPRMMETLNVLSVWIDK